MLMGILMKVLFVAVIAITIIAFVWKEATSVLPAKSCYLHKSRRCVVNYYSWYFVIFAVIWASGIYLVRF